MTHGQTGVTREIQDDEILYRREAVNAGAHAFVIFNYCRQYPIICGYMPSICVQMSTLCIYKMNGTTAFLSLG